MRERREGEQGDKEKVMRGGRERINKGKCHLAIKETEK